MFLPTRQHRAAADRTEAIVGPDVPGVVSIHSADQCPVDQLGWVNSERSTFCYDPASFQLSVNLTTWRAVFPSIDAISVEMPLGWVSDRPCWRRCSIDSDKIGWTISPRAEPASFTPRLSVIAWSGGNELHRILRTLLVEVHGMSQFEPSRDAFPQANSVAGWGRVEPSLAVFNQTFRSSIFSKRLFEGLYRSIVFIGGNVGGYGGGLCTGMARAALERSNVGSDSEPSLEQVMLWHGRQLTDRALLASVTWLLYPSPARAFAVFKRDVQRLGVTRRCFDIGVPRPWRRDIVAALQREGHTVVPYAFRQSTPERAEVLVYDPNDPDGSMAGRAIMTFDLARNTYAYRELVSMDDRLTTVVAVEQSAYRRGRTAYLAGFASAVLSLWQSMTQNRVSAYSTIQKH